MPSLILFGRWGVIALVIALGVVTLWKLLAGGFRLQGLLRAPDGSFSPARAQLLVLTVFTAVQFLLATMQNPSHLPTIPSIFIAALAGSQMVYLGGKAWTAFFASRLNKQED